MDYNRQLKEADRILHQINSTHHNILSIGGDVLSRYEQMCEDRVEQAVRETRDILLREQSELRDRMVAEAVEVGVRGREEAIKSAREERGRALVNREREVRCEMEVWADRKVEEEKERGEQRMEEALLTAEEHSRKELLSRMEEVRLEEKRLANEQLSLLRREMEGEMKIRIAEIRQEDENILNSSLHDLGDGHKIELEKVRKQDEEKGEKEINEIIKDFNSKLSQKQSELASNFAKIHKLEEHLNERDERIKKLEVKYENSRVEFSHFVDTISGLGGGYTVNKEIL